MSRITGKQILDDSLTGDDIDESTLQVTLDQVCQVNSSTSSSISVGDITPSANNSKSIGSENQVWKSIWGNEIQSLGGPLKVNSYNSKTIRTLQGVSTVTGVLEDFTFSGIGTSSFSISFWFYSYDSNSDPVSSNTRIRLMSSSTEKHLLDIGVPDATVTYRNSAGGSSTATFDTNLELSKWYHVALTFNVSDLSTGIPKLWLNGQEISSTGFSSPGGTTPSIDRLNIYLDDGTAMHDVVFWDGLLDQDFVSELYNQGYYLDPTQSSGSGNIISHFRLGEESVLSSYSEGTTMSGTIELASTVGTNALALIYENEFAILNRSTFENNPHSLEINSSSIIVNKSFTPASASDNGQEGMVAWDSNYIYVCVANNTWKRTSLSSW
jgi:hypothetical protein